MVLNSGTAKIAVIFIADGKIVISVLICSYKTLHATTIKCLLQPSV
jgi:hypothetical protein